MTDAAPVPRPVVPDRSGIPIGPIAAVVALAAVLLLLITNLPIGGPPRQTSIPTPTAMPSDAPTASPRATPATGDQRGHPQLGGTDWSIVELSERPIDIATWLHFWGGLGQGSATGEAESDCFFIAFRYAYPASGPWLTFNVSAQDDGSYTADCSPAGQAEYARIVDALGRVTYWTMLEPDRLGLLGAQNEVLIAAGPPPPLPTPPPGGDCGLVPQPICMDAATKAFLGNMFLEPGQTIAGWRVRDTIYTTCGSGLEPKYDVIIEFANPAFEKIATVGEVFGKLVACGDY